jgi:hypothetical protein
LVALDHEGPSLLLSRHPIGVPQWTPRFLAKPLWWSGKHEQHGGNVQVITAPDGWPLWTSPVRPGREHDTTALREHAEVLQLLRIWTDQHGRVLGDLGYEGEAGTITVGYKKAAGGKLTSIQKTYNKIHNGLRASVSVATRYSRPPSRRCAMSASALGGSARSSQPRSYSCISSTTAPRDHRPSPNRCPERLTRPTRASPNGFAGALPNDLIDAVTSATRTQ